MARRRPAAQHPFYVRSKGGLAAVEALERQFWAGELTEDEMIERLANVPECQEPLPASEPTDVKAGSEAKVNVMIERVRRGESPFHDDDSKFKKRED